MIIRIEREKISGKIVSTIEGQNNLGFIAIRWGTHLVVPLDVRFIPGDLTSELSIVLQEK